MNECYYCHRTDKEMRPYGPKCAMVCFECAMAIPDREAEARKNFGAQLDAAGPVAVLDGTDTGQYPMRHSGCDGVLREALNEIHPGLGDD